MKQGRQGCYSPLAAIMAVLMLLGCQPGAPEFSVSEHLPGGDMTARHLTTRSYVQAGRGIDKRTELDFWSGFSLFRDPWVLAPSSTRDRDGLGPLFNTRSCISCHHGGSRARRLQAEVQQVSGLVIRLGAQQAGVPLDANYGGQIQTRALQVTQHGMANLPAEAQIEIRYRLLNGHYADGQPYQLRQPDYHLTAMQYGELQAGIGLSPRFAPNVYGAGLLDAIAEADLLAQEDPTDADGDGISPRYNRVPDAKSGQIRIGRFGFKAKHPSLAQQVAAAFRDDIGITNSWFTEESCTQAQELCQQWAQLVSGGQPELPDKLLDLVVQFNRQLAVPPARGLDQPQVQQGRELFYQAGCAGCHTPSYQTAGDYPDTALAGQRIWPYSDLALHDMGEGLADAVHEFQATGREWRTAPLWGLGLQEKITGSSHYLHDGRARTIEEAILWHGGEAAASQQRFLHFDQQQRQALLKFLHAI